MVGVSMQNENLGHDWFVRRARVGRVGSEARLRVLEDELHEAVEQLLAGVFAEVVSLAQEAFYPRYDTRRAIERDLVRVEAMHVCEAS